MGHSLQNRLKQEPSSLRPLFDSNAQLVGWLRQDTVLFDAELRWVGFLANGQVWSAESERWLGPILDGCLLDQSGRVVAWTDRGAVRGIPTPPRPLAAARPPAPASPPVPASPLAPPVPLAPALGWSPLTWMEWLAQE